MNIECSTTHVVNFLSWMIQTSGQVNRMRNIGFSIICVIYPQHEANLHQRSNFLRRLVRRLQKFERNKYLQCGWYQWLPIVIYFHSESCTDWSRRIFNQHCLFWLQHFFIYSRVGYWTISYSLLISCCWIHLTSFCLWYPTQYTVGASTHMHRLQTEYRKIYILCHKNIVVFYYW